MTKCKKCKTGHYQLTGNNTQDFYGLECPDCGDRKVMSVSNGEIADTPWATMQPKNTTPEGWLSCKPNDPQAEQLVDGQWYYPTFGSDSLQMALESREAQVREEMALEIRKMLAFEGVLSLSVEKALEELLSHPQEK